MTKPKPIPSLTLALALILAAAGPHVAAGDPAPAPATPQDKAEALVNEYCIKCHGSEVYTRPDRKVVSRDGLDRQVRRCETALELKWFDEDIADVAEYLNHHYYRFK